MNRKCVAEGLCRLIDDPDDHEAQNIVQTGTLDSYSHDYESTTYHRFKCSAIGCTAVLECVQWHDEATGGHGTFVEKVSGNCPYAKEVPLPKSATWGEGV
jgi:hypothetical protein